MKHREVRELMTREVVTVPSSAPFKEIARTLTEHEVSAVPVVDRAGRPLGVISEGTCCRSPQARESTSGHCPNGRRGRRTKPQARAPRS